MIFGIPVKSLPSSLAPICIGLLGLFGPVNAAEWQTQLGTGQPIAVDPTTNRAVIQSGIGQGRPLWNGVHRLQDGSTITIRSGVMVPNEALSSPLPPTPPPATASQETPSTAAPEDTADQGSGANLLPPAPGWPSPRRGHCDHLVLKICGLRGTCDDVEACHLARQLRKAQHQSDDPSLGNTGWAEDQCRDALAKETEFPPCATEPALDDVACGRLVEHVCSRSSRCRRSKACSDVQELIDLEQVARENTSPTELALIRQRCVELLSEHAFFPPCR